jgi:hypothetical protein
MSKTMTKKFDVADNATKTDTLRSLILDSVTAQKAIDKKEGTVSDKLLKLAKPYQDSTTIGNYSEESADKFISDCKDQESFIRSKEARGKQVDKLPRCWTQAKSNIKAALIHGIDLSKYESESALRKAVTKARSARKGTNPVGEAMATFKKDLESMPEAQALEILKQAQAAVAAALQAIVPVEPVANDKGAKVTTITQH